MDSRPKVLQSKKFREEKRLKEKSTGKIFYRKVLWILTIHLFCLGLVPSPNIQIYNNQIKPNIFLIFINTVICISSVIQVSSYIFLEPWDNVYSQMEPTQFFCHLLHDVFLYLFLIKNRLKIVKLLREIQLNFRDYEGVILRQKTSDYEFISRKILITCSTILLTFSAALLSHVSAKIQDGTFLFPISLKIFGESGIQKNVYFFYIIQIYQFLCGCFSCLVNSTGVALTITLFVLLGSQYEILQICFENARNPKLCRMISPAGNQVSFRGGGDATKQQLFLENSQNRDEFIQGNLLEENLKICIKYHMYLKELVADVQIILNSIIFVLFAVCEFMLCLCSFQIFQIYRELSFLQLTKCFSMLVAVLFYEFTSFWYAQQLTIKTEKLFTSIYFSQWYSGSKRYKSCIRIMLLNTHRPFILNAGSIVPVTLASFVRSLQAAFSYFNLLRALTEAKP